MGALKTSAMKMLHVEWAQVVGDVSVIVDFRATEE